MNNLFPGNFATPTRFLLKPLRETLLHGVSLLGVVLFAQAAQAQPQQFTATDGTARIATDGATYSQISAANTGAALYATGAGSSITGNNLSLDRGALIGNGGYSIYATSGARVTLTGGTVDVSNGAGRNSYGADVNGNAMLTLNDVVVRGHAVAGMLNVGSTGGTLIVNRGSIQSGNLLTQTGSSILSVLGAGSRAELTDVSTATHGASVYGVLVANQATAALTNTSVDTTGARVISVAVYNDNSNLEVSGGAITTRGSSSTALSVGGTGTATLTNTQVTTTGDDSTGASVRGSGSMLTISGTGPVDNVINTTGNGAVGLSVVDQASATLTNAGIQTGGERAAGIAVTDANSTLTVSGGSITTNGESATGLSVMDLASAKLTDAAIQTNGAGSFGVVANSLGTRLEVSGGSITTNGSGAAALSTQWGASATLTNAQVQTNRENATGVIVSTVNSRLTVSGGSITTNGNHAAGVSTLGSTMLTGVSIQTNGEDATGVIVRGRESTLTISGGSIRTNGIRSFGLAARNRAVVTLKDGFVIETAGADTDAVIIWAASLTASGGSITTTGTNAVGLLARDGASAMLTNTPITTTGNDSAGVVVRNAGSTLTISGTRQIGEGINTAGSRAVGLSVTDSAAATLTNVRIETKLGSSHGAIVRDAGSALTISGGSILTSGSDAIGLSVTGGATATLTDDTVIQTLAANTTGVIVQNAGSKLTATGGGIVTTAAGSTGLSVTDRATAMLTNTGVVTSGDNASSVVVQNEGSSLTASGGAIITTGNLSTALSVTDRATVSLTNTDIQTGKDDARAVVVRNAGSSLALSGGPITTYGLRATGVSVEDQAAATLTNVTVRTNGEGAIAVAAQDSNSKLEISGGSITTGGADAIGLFVEHGATATLTNAQIQTTGDAAIGAEVSIAGSTLTVSGGSITTGGANANALSVTDQASATLTNAAIQTNGDFSSGVVASNTGTSLEISGGSITTGGTNAVGVFVTDGASATLTDTAIQTNGIDATGITVNADTTVKMTGGSIATTGDTTTEYQNSGDGASAVRMQFGGEVTLNNVQVTTAGKNTPLLSLTSFSDRTNTLTVNGGAYASTDGTAVLARGSTNNVFLNNTTVTAGNGTLIDAGQLIWVIPSPGTLTVTADHSVLTGGALITDDAEMLAAGGLPESISNLVLNNGSIWNITPPARGSVADSVLSALTVNNSTVAFAAPTGDTFQTLTVRGDYAATNAILRLNTRLDAGGPLAAQGTDRLLVNGNVTGITMVQVNPTSTSVVASASHPNLASEGISLVQVGGTAAANSFQLAGGYVALNGKPYQYRLQAYGPGAANGAAAADQRLVAGTDPHWDYRLQSVYVEPPKEPEETDERGPQKPTSCAELGNCPPPPPPPVPALVPQGASYLTATNGLFQAGQMDISNLHRRLGEIRDSRTLGADAGVGEAWLRGYGGSFDYASNRSAREYGFGADIDYAAVQLGGNLFTQRSENATTRVGLAASFGSLNVSPSQRDVSESKTSTYSLAGYATYQADRGWHVDGTLAFGWFDGEVRAGRHSKAADLSGTTFAASLEAGYPVALTSGGLVLEPQVQLTYQYLSFNNQRDMDRIAVEIGNPSQLTGRIGARLAHPFKLDSGDIITPYARANVVHGFLDGSNIHLGGDAFRAGDFGTSLELAVGATATLTQKLSLYGEAGWQTDIGSAGLRGWAATAGLRLTF